MAEKKRTSISLDHALIEETRRRDDINLSGLVNDFLSDYLAFGDATQAHLESRRAHLERRREHLQDELASIEDEIEYVEDLIADREDEWDTEEERLEGMVDAFPTGDQLRPSNPAIKTWARKLEIEPYELVDEIESRRSNGQPSVT